MAEDRRPPERLLDLGQGLALWRVHVDDLAEQPLNAQAMPPAMFARLKATVERDGRLESLPLCALTGTDPVRIDIVSGHHRTRSARAAGVFYVHCLVDETGLNPDQIRAKQLAHNAITGMSEDQLVARIFAQITDVDARLEAFVEPPAEAPAPVRLPRLDLELGYRAVTLVFLPHQADAFDKAIGQLGDDGAVPEDAGTLHLVDIELFALWQAAMRRAGREHDARAVTVQMARLIDAAAAHLGIEDVSPAGLDPDEWVPLAEVLGSALVPPGAAEVIGRAVEAMTKAGHATPKRGWEAITELCRSYAGD